MTSPDQVAVDLDGVRLGRVQIERPLYESIARQAVLEHRSTTSMVRHALQRYLESPDRPGR